jgi:hypothetical protein
MAAGLPNPLQELTPLQLSWPISTLASIDRALIHAIVALQLISPTAKTNPATLTVGGSLKIGGLQLSGALHDKSPINVIPNEPAHALFPEHDAIPIVVFPSTFSHAFVPRHDPEPIVVLPDTFPQAFDPLHASSSTFRLLTASIQESASLHALFPRIM